LGWIEGKQGYFKLADSDAWCGSLISEEDAAEILGVEALEGLKSREVEGVRYINELDLHRAFSKGRIPGVKTQRFVSFDEMILKRLIERTLDGAQLETQVKWGRKRIDFQVSWGGRTLFIEFDGPSHFIYQYERDPKEPLARKQAIEQELGLECVVWPYWMQRCERNIRALFDPAVEGLASVWSTKAMFGDFSAIDSASIIETVTRRFNAVTPEGIGYMYGNQRTPNKPVHPVVERIRAGKESPERLIPSGSQYPQEFWLPQELW